MPFLPLPLETPPSRPGDGLVNAALGPLEIRPSAGSPGPLAAAESLVHRRLERHLIPQGDRGSIREEPLVRPHRRPAKPPDRRLRGR